VVKGGSPIIVWNNLASAQLKKIYEHIKNDSDSNAEKVRNGITKIVDSLVDYPEKHPPDKFKKNNPGNYRAFEKYSLRVSYRHTDKVIKILRIRHVKQEPKEY
jgi:plasmid stabilization system protein ParE